jgi:acyl-CoA thioester hydrolase
MLTSSRFITSGPVLRDRRRLASAGRHFTLRTHVADMESARRPGSRPEMTHPFRYYLRVRYIECDAQKVVFNSRYGEYVDVAINEFLRAIGVLDDFVAGHLDFQLVKQTVEWKAPARFDQVLELSVAATRLGNTSFTIRTDFRIAGGDSRVIVTVETVYVLVDAATLTKLPLPESLRAALDAGAAGIVTDHAGYLPHGAALGS